MLKKEHQRLIFGATVLYAIAIFLLSSTTSVPGEPPMLDIPHFDKLSHVMLFGGFGLLLFHCGFFIFKNDVKKDYWAFGVGICYAILDEVHQSFVPGRSASVGDVIADTIGIFIAFLIFWQVLFPRYRLRGSRE